MFWLFLGLAAALVAFALFFLLRGLIAPPRFETPVGEDVAFFTAQKEEIERQRAAGMMDEAEARAASNEAARRLLVLSRAAGTAEVADPRRGRLAQIAVVLAVPLLAVPLYLKLGSPTLSDHPYAERATSIAVRLTWRGWSSGWKRIWSKHRTMPGFRTRLSCLHARRQIR